MLPMDRRDFLSLFGMTAGGIALEQAIPFNRVWSFPKEISFLALPTIELVNKIDFSIGDLITVNDWSGLFVTSRVNVDGTVELYGGDQRLYRRGVQVDKLNPIIIVDVIPTTVSAAPHL